MSVYEKFVEIATTKIRILLSDWSLLYFCYNLDLS